VREADACTRPGEVGALLRREGLYTSHLSAWRKQRNEGALEALSRSRGRKPAHPLEAENAELRRRLERSEAELEKARRVIEVQGNVSALLGQLLEPRGATPDGGVPSDDRADRAGAQRDRRHQAGVPRARRRAGDGLPSPPSAGAAAAADAGALRARAGGGARAAALGAFVDCSPAQV
jgi:hypothetical protein